MALWHPVIKEFASVLTKTLDARSGNVKGSNVLDRCETQANDYVKSC